MGKKVKNLEDFGRKSAEKAKRKAKKSPPVAEKIDEFKLKVAEAVQDDEGQWIARIDLDVIKALGIDESVEIEGEKKTLAIARQAYLGDRGLKLIRIDKATRRACGTGIGDIVAVRKNDFTSDLLADLFQLIKSPSLEAMPPKNEKLFECFIKSHFEQLERDVKEIKSLDGLVEMGSRISKMRLAISDDVLALYLKEKARLLKMIEEKTGGAVKLQAD